MITTVKDLFGGATVRVVDDDEAVHLTGINNLTEIELTGSNHSLLILTDVDAAWALYKALEAELTAPEDSK